MKKILILFAFFGVNQMHSQTLTNTDWYLTHIEENNQLDNVPLSENGTTPGNWHFRVESPTSEEENALLSSTYCSSFLGSIVATPTTFDFYLGQMSLTLNLPCEWMTSEEQQYFSKYYDFYENYRDDTFLYIINHLSGYSQLVITNDAGDKAYYSTIPLSTEDPLEQFVKIYPNPFEERFFIEDYEQVIDEVKIFDNMGRLIKVVLNPEPVQEIMTDFSSGIYHIHIETKDGRIMNKKMIKE